MRGVVAYPKLVLMPGHSGITAVAIARKSQHRLIGGTGHLRQNRFFSVWSMILATTAPESSVRKLNEVRPPNDLDSAPFALVSFSIRPTPLVNYQIISLQVGVLLRCSFVGIVNYQDSLVGKEHPT